MRAVSESDDGIGFRAAKLHKTPRVARAVVVVLVVAPPIAGSGLLKRIRPLHVTHAVVVVVVGPPTVDCVFF